MKKHFSKGLLGAIVGITAVSPIVARITGDALSEKFGVFRQDTDFSFDSGQKSFDREAPGTSEISLSGVFNQAGMHAPLRANTKTDAGYLPPYESEFTANGLDEWTTLDLNEDGATWVIQSNTPCLKFNSSDALNDWLISPALIVEAGKLYTFTFEYKVQSKASPERFEVAMGNANTAEAMTDILMESTVVDNQDYIKKVIRFVAKDSGAVYFGFHGISDANTYALYINNVTLSAGASTSIPEAVSDLKLEPENAANNAAKISFKVPSKTYLGNTLSSITKIEVMRNGELVKTFESPTPGAELSFVDKVPGGANYEYVVTSTNDAGVSPDVAVSDYVGSLEAPFASNFANKDITGWTIIDGNDDGKIWLFNSGAIRVQYNTYVDMDDWLITPPVKMEADRGYKLTFQSKCYKVTHPEKLIVTYGEANTVEAQTNILLDTLDITSNAYGDFEAIIAPKKSGAYYVGFHGVSPMGKYYLYLNNIKIAEGVSTVAPGAPTDLVLTPGENAAHTALVEFNAPSETLNGNPLADLSEVRVLRDSVLVKTFETPLPGEKLSFTDDVPHSGTIRYTVVGYNEIGEGLPLEGDVYVGYAPAEAPASADIELTTNAGEVKVSWEPVSIDDNGITIPSELITYSLYNGKEYVAEGLTGTSYTYQAVEAGKQQFVQLAVHAVGDGVNGHPAYTEMIPVGSPYQDYAESFGDGKLHFILGSTPTPGGSLKLATDETLPGFSAMDGDNGYLYVAAQTAGAGAEFFTGLISLDNLENPGLVFHTYNITGDASVIDDNPVAISVRRAGHKEYEEIYSSTVDEICGGNHNSWGTARVSLADYEGEMVQIKFQVTCTKYAFTMFDALSVESIPAKDIELQSITAPQKVKIGSDYEVSVRIANKGAKDADSYTLDLYANGAVIDSRKCDKLVAGSYAAETFTLFMSPTSPETVEYYAVATFDGDEDNANNTTVKVSVTPITNSYPVPEQLVANNVEDAVVLTWNRPANVNRAAGEVYTEDFESGEAFADSFGNWLFLDEDMSPVGGFQNLIIPGIERGESTGSFWVWDAEWSDEVAGTKAEGYRAHSGSKYIFSLYRFDDEAVNDYAVSPKLTGAAQTISFYAHSYSPNYPEKIEVLYSTGGLEADDFVGNVAMAETTVPGSWTEYTVELPEGARYFAIHSVAKGSFMLMIDDVTFIPEEDQVIQLSLKGYNVYRNGVKITGSPVETNTYSDSDVSTGEDHKYIVTAVYEQGESKGSNEAWIKVSSIESVNNSAVKIVSAEGSIVIVNAAGLGVAVTAADGVVCYTGEGKARMTVDVVPGIYVVKVGQKTQKVIVR